MRMILFRIEQILVLCGAACHPVLLYCVMGIFAVGIDHVFMSGTKITPEMMGEIRSTLLWISPFLVFFWIWIWRHKGIAITTSVMRETQP